MDSETSSYVRKSAMKHLGLAFRKDLLHVDISKDEAIELVYTTLCTACKLKST